MISKIEHDNFVIVKFVTHKRDRFLQPKLLPKVAQLVFQETDRHQKQYFFVCPDASDVSVVQREQIIKKLSGKLLRRLEFYQ